ncbi:UNVERIFIED_CONTAM: hypothetical protein Sradi_0893400 [Sesamum radiatum]|uniref:Ty3-gypsy retrotransposon protein n=1 Tax=Sesamum radiatum TaxID=300843 RepID=A0AAW2V5C1_SESRA
MRHLSTKPKEIAYPIQKQAPGPGIHIRREESSDYFEFKRLLKLCVNKFLARPLGPSLPLIPSIYVRTQDTSSKHSMAPKMNQVVMIEKNVINSTTVGQSFTGGKIVNTTPSNGSNSVSSTKINLNSTPFVTLPAMVTKAITKEEQVAQMAQAKCDLQKIVEDKDLQIVQLMNKLEPTNAGESSHNHSSSPKHDGQEKQAYEELPMQQSVKKSSYSATSIALLSVQQLLEMIANTIKVQYGESTQNSPAYSKPYSKRIDTLRMPISYRHPKLQQFDGKCNPKQHIAHFIKTCNNAGTDGDHLVKQFVQSLKGNAFDWYVDLEPESIDSCDKMEREFLNRFYSTRRTVSMIANAK